MISVAVETSTATGSVALFANNKLLGEKTWSRDGSHSEFLTDCFSQLLNEHKILATAVQRVAVGVGPGSFTGVRVAVNFARALAFANSAKVYCLNSLELLALQPSLQNHVGRLSVVQFGFRDIVYAATYEQKLVEGRAQVFELEKPAALTAESLELKLNDAHLVIGDATTRLSARFSPEFLAKCLRQSNVRDIPMASDFVNSAFFMSNPTLTDWIHTIPLYIRASEAEEKLKRGLLTPS